MKIDPRRLLAIHRAVGAVVAAFLVLLAITGVALNHTEALALDQRHLDAPWVRALYGIPEPEPEQAFAAGQHWLSNWNGRLFLDHRPLATESRGELVGAFAVQGILAVITARELLLLTPEGQRIDALAYPGDGTARAAAMRDDRIILGLADGRIVATNPAFTAFRPADVAAPAVSPATGEALPAGIRTAIREQARGPGITLERLILDLHSGRIAGPVGVWLMDAVAVALVALVASGLGQRWILRRRHKRPR